MENENIIDGGAVYQGEQLSVTPTASGYLSETGKWAKFLAIVGFCFIGLIVLIGLFAGTAMSAFGGDALPFPGFVFGLFYVLIGAIYFFPLYYLIRFATQVRTALVQRNTQLLETAFENLKSHYKFIGILMVIVLALYLLAFGGGILAGAFM